MNKIFIADELVPLIKEQKSLLSRTNVKLFTAATAEEVLEIHRKEGMDLIIADLDMPEMGGDRLCALIRKGERYGRVYFIIICTGRKEDLKRCEKAEANSYITKPFDPEEIAARVSRLLEIPKRKDVRVLVKVTVHGQFRAEPFFCTSRDVSVSGILIDAGKTLARGDRITCSFFLPHTDRVNIDGEVVRVVRGSTSAYSYGVRFLEPPEEARAKINSFVTSEAERSANQSGS